MQEERNVRAFVVWEKRGMRVLITGAGGFIGSHLVDACKRDGHSVQAVDLKPWHGWIRSDEMPDNSSGRLDVSDSSQSAWVEDFDVCYHMAAESRIQPSFQFPEKTVRTNVLGTVNILEKARLCGGRVVYAGSSTADDELTKNVYCMSKFQGEELCRTWHRCFGTEVVVTRFYNVYGPRQVEDGRYATVIGIFEKQKREGKSLTVSGDGSQRRDFTHVDDIVSGLIACAERADRDGSVYNLGTGRNWSVLEVAKMFGNSVEFYPRPPGEAEETQADISRTTNHTGWKPSRRLENYVESVLEKLNVVA